MISRTRRINVSSGRPLEEKAHYSRAIRVGNWVYQSGTTAIDSEGNVKGEGDIAKQIDFIMGIAEESIGSAEGRIDDIVRARVYVVDNSLIDSAGKAFFQHFRKVQPALSLIPVSRLARPTQLVEIELEAVDNAKSDANKVNLIDSELERYGASDSVRIGDRVLVSSISVQGSDSVDQQIRKILGNIRVLIERHGSNWNDLVYTKSYLSSFEEIESFTTTFADTLGTVKPVGTLLGVPFWPNGENRYAIEAEAVISDGKRRRNSGSSSVGPFSECVEVGQLIYLSTQLPLRASGEIRSRENWAKQNDACIQALSKKLKEANSKLSEVVVRRIFTLKQAEMNRAYGEGPGWFKDSFPVALGCRIQDLGHPAITIGIEAFAIRNSAEEIEWRRIPKHPGE